MPHSFPSSGLLLNNPQMENGDKKHEKKRLD